MKMWNPFKKNKLQILAPVNGEIIPIEEVPDPVFSQKMMGEGIALVPREGKIVSPINGTVILVPDTKHAIGLKSDDGTEILVHVGLETVALKGEGFNVLVKENETVYVGQTLLEVDWDYIKANAKSSITPIVITNGGNKKFITTKDKEGIAGKTIVLTAE
jgi:PTS system glucose-specific IIA component